MAAAEPGGRVRFFKGFLNEINGLNGRNLFLFNLKVN